MAMFGFVYLWYLMAVLLLEIWLDYRRDIVLAVTVRYWLEERSCIACSPSALRTSAPGRCAWTTSLDGPLR